MARGFNANKRLGLGCIEMRQRFAQRGSETARCDLLRRDAQDGFAEAINFVRGLFEFGSLRIARCAGDHDLQRMARVKQGREAIGGGE